MVLFFNFHNNEGVKTSLLNLPKEVKEIEELLVRVRVSSGEGGLEEELEKKLLAGNIIIINDQNMMTSLFTDKVKLETPFLLQQSLK